MTERRNDGKTERRKDNRKPLSVLPSVRLSFRLHTLGLPHDRQVVPHHNRRVLVSLTTRGALPVHAGYAGAPDEVLSAIVRWARPPVRRAGPARGPRPLAPVPVPRPLAPP